MVFKSFVLLACFAWDGVVALSLHQREVPAVVKLPITRRTDNPIRLEKRTSTVSTSFEVELPVFEPLYYTNLTIGTPPQSVQVQLNTSSGYLQATATNATWCTFSTSNCASGFFDVDASSTYKFANGDFNVTYFTPDDIFTGDFGNDDVVIDHVTLSAMDLAVNYGVMPQSILGLGYIPGKDAPATVLQALVNGGHIKSAAYSLWVDGPEDMKTEGTILFGGVDTAKYAGDLHTMSIPASNGIHYFPVVLVTEVTLQNGTSSSHTSGLPEYMALDSFVSQTFLPNDVVEGLYQDLSAVWNSENEVGIIDCAMKQTDYNITLTFVNFTISSPLSDFIGPGTGDTCELRIVPNFGETSVLGDNFLRNAYVVYDLSNNEISMAPTNFNESEGQVLEIGSGTSPISGIFETVTAVATVPTAVVRPSGGQMFPAESTSVSTATSTSKGAAAAPTANSNNIMAGLVGAGLLIAL